MHLYQNVKGTLGIIKDMEEKFIEVDISLIISTEDFKNTGLNPSNWRNHPYQALVLDIEKQRPYQIVYL